MAGKNQSIKIVAENRRARHEYHIHETFEAGIVLTGTEIKSLRGGRANLTDSYAKVENSELFLISAHISPYEQGNRFNHEPRRNRKLLMHKAEIMLSRILRLSEAEWVIQHFIFVWWIIQQVVLLKLFLQ